MNQKCSFCPAYTEIVYRDETITGTPKIFINICWKCFQEFKVGSEITEAQIENDTSPNLQLILLALAKIKELFPKMLICSSCQEKFIPNKEGQTLCYDCYKKSKTQEVQNKIWRFE